MTWGNFQFWSRLLLSTVSRWEVPVSKPLVWSKDLWEYAVKKNRVDLGVPREWFFLMNQFVELIHQVKNMTQNVNVVIGAAAACGCDCGCWGSDDNGWHGIWRSCRWWRRGCTWYRWNQHFIIDIRRRLPYHKILKIPSGTQPPWWDDVMWQRYAVWHF